VGAEGVAEADVTTALKVADRVGVGTMAEVEVGTADGVAVEVKTEVGVAADVRIGGASQTGVGGPLTLLKWADLQ